MGAMTTTAWVAVVLGCAVVALVLVSSAARRRTAAEQQRRLRLEEELTRARADVATLGRRLDDLGLEVAEAREAAERAAAGSAQLATRADREFVITSVGRPDPAPVVVPRPASHPAPRPSAVLEERLVRSLGRRGRSSGAAGRLVVGAVALGHGVRRALSPEVLDRAAAEATVARRRSRRDRRRELREARHVVRSLRSEQVGKHVA